MKQMSADELDLLVDTDPLRLRDKAIRLLRENERLRRELDEAQVRSMIARNPGIDEAEVRRIRASGA